MDAALQSKVNLLGVLLVAFTLLSVPIFTQAKADTFASIKDAPNTLLSKVFRDVAKDFNLRNPQDLEIEDWSQRAHENNPDCGPACDPDGDLDGDGVSNAEELRQGRNPACNEDEHGHEYCQRQMDQYNVTDPDDPNLRQPMRVELYNIERWVAQSSNSPEEGVLSAETEEILFDEFHFYFNATHGNSGYRVTVTDPDGAIVFEMAYAGSTLATSSQPQQPYEETHVEPSMGVYTVRLVLENSQPATFAQTMVDLVVVGVVK